jgi:hypothetical protein
MILVAKLSCNISKAFGTLDIFFLRCMGTAPRSRGSPIYQSKKFNFELALVYSLKYPGKIKGKPCVFQKYSQPLKKMVGDRRLELPTSTTKVHL